MCALYRKGEINMCTRKFAIQTVIKETSGSKDALIGKIGHFYEAFLTMGFIREKISIDRNGPSSNRIQWEATPLANERADFFID